MKIAIDVREACEQKTGKGWYTLRIVEELLNIDQVNEYFLYSSNTDVPFKSNSKVHIRSIAAKSSQWHFKVIKDLKKEKPDIFFAPTSYIIPSLAPSWLNVVITVHDLVAFLFPSTHNTKAMVLERLTLKRALKKATAITAVSENTKHDLRRKFPKLHKDITVIPCAPSDFFREPLNDAILQKFKQEKKLPDHFVLGVGTLEPRKNFVTLIKSFAIVKQQYPEYKLIIVGKKGWQYEEIEAAVKELQLEEDVLFPGYVEGDELKNMYALAAVFVFPSFYEGFGIPPLEAMAAGCPVISSNVASLPEVVGEAGLLIDPYNSRKLADSIMSLIKDESLRQLLIERGKHQAEKFSWRNSAIKLLDIFKQLIIKNEEQKTSV